jgi:hypothetical protein
MYYYKPIGIKISKDFKRKISVVISDTQASLIKAVVLNIKERWETIINYNISLLYKDI